MIYNALHISSILHLVPYERNDNDKPDMLMINSVLVDRSCTYLLSCLRRNLCGNSILNANIVLVSIAGLETTLSLNVKDERAKRTTQSLLVVAISQGDCFFTFFE